jgi:hypothetical protein
MGRRNIIFQRDRLPVRHALVRRWLQAAGESALRGAGEGGAEAGGLLAQERPLSSSSSAVRGAVCFERSNRVSLSRIAFAGFAKYWHVCRDNGFCVWE